MYIFLKSIAAIIHFWALIPPYNREAFRPPYTPRSIYAFLQPKISVCIPLRPSVYVFEEHCCHHTFLIFFASIPTGSILLILAILQNCLLIVQYWQYYCRGTPVLLNWNFQEFAGFALLSDEWHYVPARWCHQQPIHQFTHWDWDWVKMEEARNYDSMLKYQKSASLILILMFVDKKLKKPAAAESGGRVRKR